MIKLAFTCGDINGIGPEISVKTFNQILDPDKRKIYFFSPKNAFEKACSLVSPKFKFEIVNDFNKANQDSSIVSVIDFGNFEMNIGSPTKHSGSSSMKSFKDSFKYVYEKRCDALVTNPISKVSFKLAGIEFSGHTELLAEWSNKKRFLMFFLSENLKAAPVTIHVPLFRVTRLVTSKRIRTAVEVMTRSLRDDFNVQIPKIAVLGMNPHAGEEGNIGREEEDVIIPAIRKYEHVFGPFVPDAFFGNKEFEKYDAVLGMYHDQVLIPFKMMNFSSGVNYTAGLPVVRTSPDHGTAFNIAYQGKADNSSLISSVNWAEKIVTNRRSKIHA